ncbi:MAG: regulator SirB [Proteobacteria bacterium]|nr:regulator SirB [Pseudomonadota bacterium]
MDYLDIRTLHVTRVVLSISLFVLRSALQLAGIKWRQQKWLRITPHLIDTVLLGSALWLSMLLHQYPFVNAWLTAKLLALLAYIAIGREVLSEKASRRRSALALGAALTCVT